MTELHQLVRQIATGSSFQKRRAWSQLFDAGNYWSSCREAARQVSSVGELATAYGELAGGWDRRPVQEMLEAEDEDESLEVLISAAARSLAAAGVAAVAASPLPDARLMAWWVERAIGSGTLAPVSAPPPDSQNGEALIRHWFRSLAWTVSDRNALSVAQDTAVSLFHGTRANEGRSPSRRLRLPVLLARGAEGFLAWLWLERLDHGFGQFFQAPDTRFDPLRRDLRAAVEQAFYYVNHETPLASDEDVRWWLSSLPGSRAGSPAAISGASLQGATAVGLVLLLEEHPYNPMYAVSATLLPDGGLGPVMGLSGGAPKLRAALRLRTASVNATVIVSPANQPSDAMSAEWEARGVRVVVAATVSKASQLIREASAPHVTTPTADPPATNIVPPFVEPAPPAPPPQPKPSVPTGGLPLGTPYYVLRPTDAQFASAIERQDGIVRIKGARQMGKTSLLARGLQQARDAGATVVITDCQMFNAVHLASAETFLNAVARWFIRNLKLDTRLEDVWDPLQGPNWNFRDFLLGEVLGRLQTPVVWALDDVDRLFSCEFGSEVFGLFRSWFNERALDPTVPWSRFTIAMAHATEANLFITEPHLSPFNVGSRVSMEDFTREETADLNQRYGRPLKSEQELDAYFRLFGGQPYLTHRGLHQMATEGTDFQTIEATAQSGEGVFSEHLGRLVLMLSENRELCDAVRSVMHGNGCASSDQFQRLWSAGIFTGGSAREARLRCELYGRYLESHLP